MKNKSVLLLLIIFVGGFVYIYFFNQSSNEDLSSNEDDNTYKLGLVEDAIDIYEGLLSVENTYKMNISRFHEADGDSLEEEGRLYYAMHLSEKDFIYNDNESNYECDFYSQGVSALDFDECGYFKVSLDAVEKNYVDMFVEGINFEDLNMDEDFHYNLFVSCNILSENIECFRAVGGYTDDIYHFVSIIDEEEIREDEIILTEKVVYVKYNFNEELYQVLENTYIEGNISYDMSIFKTEDNLEKLIYDNFDEKEKEEIINYYLDEGEYVREVEHTFGIINNKVYYSHSSVK